MELKLSSELEQDINALNCTKELRHEIETFVKYGKIAYRNLPISQTVFRANLHYIIDNICKDGLINELRKANKSNANK